MKKQERERKNEENNFAKIVLIQKLSYKQITTLKRKNKSRKREQRKRVDLDPTEKKLVHIKQTIKLWYTTFWR